MAEKLMDVELLPRREKKKLKSITLDKFIEQYIVSKPGMKPNTLKNYRQTQKSLIGFFGNDKKLLDITPGDCDEWHAAQIGRGYAQATIGRNVKRARQFFRAAVRKKLIVENPLEGIKAAAQVNKSREYFISQEATEKIIAACPDAEWRLIVALTRYGGLRTPSEIFALRWGDVDWERSRITIRSPKTAHHPGGGVRQIPLFPELRPYLETVFDEALEGSEYVITKHRISSGNLRTTFEKIIKRAGLVS